MGSPRGADFDWRKALWGVVRVRFMAHTEFGVKYDGPALTGGTMDVRDLAPALLALGDLFVAAGRVVEKDAEPPSLQIRATAEGSFVVDLALQAAGAWDGIKGWLNGETGVALVALSGMVGGPSGLFALWKWRQNRRISRVEHLRPGWIRLIIEEDGRKTTFEGPAELLPLLQNADVRRAAARVVEPLKRRGIESLELIAESEAAVTIRAEDVGAFTAPDVPDEVVNQQETEMVVTIETAALKDTNRWRLSDGDQNFYATLADEDFQSRVDRGIEAFRAGDMFRCRIRTVQVKRQSGILHTTREIIAVIEHIPRDQLSIGDLIDDPDISERE